ncbi:MAG: hypothetical protein WAV98_03530 [Minisyncoccia bacterium]
MVTKVENEDVPEVKDEDTRMHFRDYLRMTEIVAVMILVVVVVVGVAFRGGAPVTVNTDALKVTDTVSTSTKALPRIIETESFVVADMGKVEGSAKENITTADTKIFTAPENFKSFSYDATLGKKIALAGTCRDAYYAFLIFKGADDYRKDPTRAYYNTAYPCPANRIIALELNLKDINLPSGSYYLFLADQGNTGSWYNPR